MDSPHLAAVREIRGVAPLQRAYFSSVLMLLGKRARAQRR
jgi:hypothetical protein